MLFLEVYPIYAKEIFMTKQILAFGSLLLCSSLLNAATLPQQSKKLSLTLYNSDIALVHEEKELTLYKDEKRIIYEGIAKEIEMSSLYLGAPKELEVESVAFAHDLPTQEQLLRANVNKKVDIRRKKSAYEYETIPATLLGYENQRAMVQTIAGEIVNVKNSSVIFDALPKEFRLKPTLEWSVQTAQNIKSDIELEYLVNGVSFEPYYALYLDKNSSELIGSVILSNNSGADYKDAEISLLAGDINRVQESAMPLYKNARAMSLASSSDQMPQRVSIEGYHLYTLPKKISLSHGETKQLGLFEKSAINTQRKYVAQMSNPLYLRGEERSDLSMYLLLDAIDEPLLNATLRSYSKENNTTVFLGESKIKATPKGESIEVLLGRDFDLFASQTLIKRQESKESISSDILYVLKNSSQESKELTLLVAFNKKSGSLIKSDRDYSYTKGNFVTFKINLGAGASEEFSVHFESEK